MTGARELGSPCQHRLAMETDRTRPRPGNTGDDHEALTGFDIHDVKDS